MSRSSYRAPFHRRILPWLSLAVFLALAPVVVFYTAGYRYNPKKSIVERNGTLILDSTPRGATVLLDGRETGEKTPITLQNVAPGIHHIRLVREGFYPWEKELDVRAEQVTFANTIWMWRQAESQLYANGVFSRLMENQERSVVAIIEQNDATSSVRFLDENGITQDAVLKKNLDTSTLRLRWRDGGSELLVGGEGADANTWLVRTSPDISATPLPNGWYTWYEGALLGNDGRATIRIVPRNSTTERVPLVPPIVATIGDLTLRTGSSSRELLLADNRVADRVLRLPIGRWIPMEEQRGRWFFSESNRWLALGTADRQPISSRAEGDWLRWDPDGNRSLLLSATEINLWDGQGSPDPIWRQSDQLVNVLWHRSGQTLFLATHNTVHALEMDARGGRQVTTLARFDEIRDLAILGRMLLVSGRRGDVDGVWGVRVE